MAISSAATNLLGALLPEWHLLLQEWSASGRLTAAAQEALLLNGEPGALADLTTQWSAGYFSGLPPIVLLSAADMNGAMGAYALSTGTIYLNADWLATASQDQVNAVLTEELGHHLDGLLNIVDTPGDEGEIFSRLLSGTILSDEQKDLLRIQKDSATVTSGGLQIAVETAATPTITPIRQLALAGDNYAGEASSDGTYLYIPSVTAGEVTLGKYNLLGDRIWERSLGGGGGGSSAIAADGSILVASPSDGISGKVSTLARFNSNGDKIWEITNAYARFGGDIVVSGTTVYVSGGTGVGFNSANTAFVNAYSLETGVLIWSKTYANSGASYISDLEVVGDRIYCAAALYGKVDFDTAIAGSLDLNGNEIWWKSAPAPDWNSITAITVVGNQVIGTGYKADGSDRGDARVISFSTVDGTINWDKSWGDGNFQSINAITTVGGKIYVAYGDGIPWNSSNLSGGYSTVAEIDASGNLVNTYTYDVQGFYDSASYFVKAGESLYVLGQTTGTISGQSSGGGQDIYLASVIIAPTPNNAPTDLNLSTSGILENSIAGSVIGTLSATDPDAGSTFTYALVAGDGTNDADNALVEIVGDEVRVKSGASIDFETNPTLNLNIQVTDNGTPGLTYTKAVTASVLNSNEAPTDLNLSSSAFNENIPSGSAVATLSSIDPDAADTFIYSLVPGTGDTDNAAFSIVDNQLKITSSPDFETKSSYTFRIRTTDAGGLWYEKNVTLSVNDLTEAGNFTGTGGSTVTGTVGDDTYTGFNTNNTFNGLGGYDRATRSGNSSNYTISGTNSSSVIESITTVKTGKTTSTVVSLLDALSNTESVQINGGISNNTINAGGGTSNGITRTAFSGTFIAFGGAGVDTITGGTYKNWLGGQGFAAGVISGIDTITGTTNTANGAMDVFDLRNTSLTGAAYVGGAGADYARIANFNTVTDKLVLTGQASNYSFALTQVVSGGKVKTVTDQYWAVSTNSGDLIAQVRGNLTDFSAATSVLYGTGDQTTFGLGF